MVERQRSQIGVIGTSHIFTGPVARDLVHEPRLKGSEVLYFDTSRERAEANANVCNRYAQAMGSDIRFLAVPTSQAAIEGSDFVLNAALSGGREWGDRVKRQVAGETGIYGPIEAHSPYRQLKLLQNVAEQVAILSPNGYLIQCANPIPEGGTLATKTTDVKFIGVCHGYKEWEHLARLLGMNPDLAAVKIAGINHDVWLLEFLYQNVDAYPRLDDWLKNVSEHFYQYFLPYAKNVDYQLTPVAMDLYRRFGRFPIGDTPRASTPDLSRYGYHDSSEAESLWFGREQGFESAAGEASSRAWRTGNLEAVQRVAADKNASVLPLFSDNPSGWQIVPIMASIATDQSSTQMVNVPNKGVIPGLADDLVVEIPAIVNAQGAHAEGTIEIPERILSQALQIRQEQAMAHVQAFLTGDKKYLVHQILANPKVKANRVTAEKIVDIWMANDPDMAVHFSR